MKESYFPCQSLSPLFVDKGNAFCRQRLKLLIDIIDLKTDVMYALALLLQKLGHSALRICRLYQLDLNIADH